MEQSLFVITPRKVLLTGRLAIYTEELPSTWTGMNGGLDLDLDGVIDAALNLTGGLLGIGDGGSGSDYRLVPVRLSLNVNVTDGPRSLNAGLLLWR